MPRKSAAELAIVTPATTGTASRLTPPASLSTAERLEFIALAAENKHLRRTDAPMLATYCMAVTRVAKLSRGKDGALWERAIKVMLALARSMRLTQQAQADPKTVGRLANRIDPREIERQMNEEARLGAQQDALDELNGVFDDGNDN